MRGLFTWAGTGAVGVARRPAAHAPCTGQPASTRARSGMLQPASGGLAHPAGCWIGCGGGGMPAGERRRRAPHLHQRARKPPTCRACPASAPGGLLPVCTGRPTHPCSTVTCASGTNAPAPASPDLYKLCRPYAPLGSPPPRSPLVSLLPSPPPPPPPQVFDFALWKKHRSSSRYLRHILGLPSSRIVFGLAGPLLYVLSLSLAVAVYNASAEASLMCPCGAAPPPCCAEPPGSHVHVPDGVPACLAIPPCLLRHRAHSCSSPPSLSTRRPATCRCSPS